MVTPPALMAATPVGATIIMRLGVRSRRVLRKVVLPVPAFPVRKRLVLVRAMYSHAKWSSLFFIVEEAGFEAVFKGYLCISKISRDYIGFPEIMCVRFSVVAFFRKDGR